MDLTAAELRLISGLLSHYILGLQAQLRNPASPLTAEGRARYRADIELAAEATAKLNERRQVAA